DAREPAAAPVPAAPADPELPPGSQRGTVSSGQSLSRIAASFGQGGAAIAELVAALTPVMDPATVREGTAWSAQLDEAGVLQSFTLERSVTTRIEVGRDAHGKLVARELELPTVLEQVAIAATIDSSLSAAIVGAGGDAGVVASVVDVFASDIDFYTDPRVGDRIALVVERRKLGDEVVEHRRVLAAVYRGDEVGEVRGLWWTPPGASSGSWYTPAGKSLDRTLLKSPLKYTRLSSGFNPKRMHPVLHRVKGHYGVDYAAPVGTPVWAAAGGEIVFRGEKGPAGNMIVLAHDGGFSTVYMHLSKFAAGQAVGSRVAQKSVIGYVGTTGRSTGPHLHFGVKRSGRWVDPSLVRAIERPGVSAKQRARFDRDTGPLAARLDVLLAEPAVPADTATPP
ncbi:MAG: peptidoglycan DD-metalloendopeptidase family protein, partial [Deltaproteobacteria bacterium]|nr:peptidoglycan DD-metalloendopeptidase family protein [Nannocystaceae bacterium]